jgi:hypothetical protein
VDYAGDVAEDGEQDIDPELLAEEVRAAVEDFAPECEFATLELRKHLPEWTPEARAEGLLPATEVAIRRELAVIVDGLSCGIEFARVWFGINL